MRKIEEITVPAWSGSVLVRVLTAGEKEALDVEFRATRNVNYRARLVTAVICDANGERIFDASDIAALAQYPAETLQPIIDAALRVNKWSTDEIEQLESRLQEWPVRRFMIRLAAMLHKSIAEIECIDTSELEEWLAFERLYGIPDTFFLTSQICSTLKMCLTTSKNKIHPGDMVPYFREDPAEQTPADMLATLGRMAKAQEK